ncbi:NUDIX domain-containing protein [Candidatus Saccharibacteria bacterium]|nr:NUDIX domain-containing protein [Candidatus Saccharibacteria bacterium]
MQKIVPETAILIPEDAQCVFQGEIYGVYQWKQVLYDGSQAKFEMLKRPDTATAICLVDNSVLVLNEEQPHRGRRMCVPGGRVDPEDADMLSAAQREVLEETGYSFEKWRLIRVTQPINKIEWFVYVWLAWEPTGRQEATHDAGEKIHMKQLSLRELKQLIHEQRRTIDEAFELFDEIDSLDELLEFSEYTGKIVDR